MDHTTRTTRTWFDIRRHEDPPADPAPAAGLTTDPAPVEPTADGGTPDARPNDVPAMEAALRKANREAEKYRLRVKEFEDRDKSEQEKLEERAKAAEESARKAEEARLRAEVALDKGLPKALAARLQGATLEEMQADADALLALIPPTPGEPAPNPPDPAGAGVGVKGDPPKPVDLRNVSDAEFRAARDAVKRGQVSVR